jgi:sRNA-binding protein
MSKSDWKRGAAESRQQIELLRARWPKAFPAKGHEVRPLANAAPAIAEALGWSNAYARGVLSPWVLREAYCRAVLAHAMRINLDGSESELTVDDEARAMAAKRLEQIAARKAQEAERAAAAKPPAPSPEPAPQPVAQEPAQEPPRARKILTLGASAKEALLKRGLGTTEVVATIQRRAR